MSCARLLRTESKEVAKKGRKKSWEGSVSGKLRNSKKGLKYRITEEGIKKKNGDESRRKTTLRGGGGSILYDDSHPIGISSGSRMVKR